MLSLKKTALAVLALGISGAASAAMYAPAPAPVCTPGNVTVPCETSAWDLGIEALYLQPLGTANGSYYNMMTNAAGATTYYSNDSDWDWGWRLEGSYHFGTGSDFTVNWSHFETDGYVGPWATAVVNVSADFYFDSKFDQFNMEFGQHVDFGEHVNTRFHGGLQYAKIRNNASWAAWNVAVPAVNTATLATYSSFEGWGPRVGADTSYDFGNGFSIFANSAAALLVGDSDWNVMANAVGVPATSGYASHRQVVPELEAKLGVKYTHAMAQGDLTFDLGYQVMNYFNAQMTAPSVGGIGGGAGADSSYALQGIFFGAKWVGNVA